MKITIETIRQIIKEELEEIYKGDNRIIYGPDTKTIKNTYSPEVGSYALPEESPYYKLHPLVQKKFPLKNEDGELIDDASLKQAYELDLMVKGPKPPSPEEIAQQELDALRTPRSRARRAKYPSEDTGPDDFVQAVKLFHSPDKVIKEPVDLNMKAIKDLRAWVKANIPREIPHPEIEGKTIPNPEFYKYRRKINQMKTRYYRLKASTLDNVYDHDTTYDIPLK